MPHLYLNQSSLGFLTQFILALAIALYLLSLKNKSTAAWLLGGFFAGVTALSLCLFMTGSLSLLDWHWLSFFFSISPVINLGMVAVLIQFAYYFPHPLPGRTREARIALLLSTLVTLVGLGLAIYLTFQPAPTHILLRPFFLLAGYLWAIIVLLRQTIHFSTN